MKESIGRFLTVERWPDLPNRKTHRWGVYTHGGDLLGDIQWYPSWRQYTFDPIVGSTYSEGCLMDLARFIRSLKGAKDCPASVQRTSSEVAQ